jgi:hypothetical protein
MFAANSYRIRIANSQDAEAVRDLIERNCDEPLTGQVLIGELDGVVAAAMSLSDGRVIADNTRRAGHLVATLRARAVSAWAYSATPSTSERLLAASPTWYRLALMEADVTDDGREQHEAAEHEPVLA